MGKKYNIIEVVEASAITSNEVFNKDTLITFYNDTSKFKIADGKTRFNDLSEIGGGGSGIPPEVQAALDAKSNLEGGNTFLGFQSVDSGIGVGDPESTYTGIDPGSISVVQVSFTHSTLNHEKLEIVSEIDQDAISLIKDRITKTTGTGDKLNLIFPDTLIASERNINVPDIDGELVVDSQLTEKLTATPATAVPDSVATTVEELVVDFNTLLASLRTAGTLLI